MRNSDQTPIVDNRDRTITVSESNFRAKVSLHEADGYQVISKVPMPDGGYLVTLRHKSMPGPGAEEVETQKLRDEIESLKADLAAEKREKENLQGDLTRANNKIGELEKKLKAKPAGN